MSNPPRRKVGFKLLLEKPFVMLLDSTQSSRGCGLHNSDLAIGESNSELPTHLRQNNCLTIMKNTEFATGEVI